MEECFARVGSLLLFLVGFITEGQALGNLNYHGGETSVVFHHLAGDAVDGRLVRQFQFTAQGIGEKVLAESKSPERWLR